MRAIKGISDKFAIGLSLLCAIHCLILPIILALLPSLAGLPLEHESFHMWMLIIVIPLSLLTLTMGCRKHQHYQLLSLGLLGILLLTGAVLLEDIVGETGEIILTMMGAALIAIGHFGNFRLCHRRNDNHCQQG